MRKKFLKFLLSMTMVLSLVVSNYAIVFAQEETDGILSASGITEVLFFGADGWLGNGNQYGIGTYPGRHIVAFALEYDGVVDTSNLDADSFSIIDKEYEGMDNNSGTIYNNGELAVTKVYTNSTPTMNEDGQDVEGNYLILETEIHTKCGSFSSADFNYRRRKVEFEITQNVDVQTTDGTVLASLGTKTTVDQNQITEIGTGNYKELKLTSETAGNDIYLVYSLPENYDASKKYPMVFHITGGGQQYAKNTSFDSDIYGEDNWGVELDIDAVPYTFATQSTDTIVVSMQSIKARDQQPEGYSAHSDVNQAVDYFINHYSVDTDRIYAIGNSQGGVIMSKAVAQRPDLYAAYIPCNTSIAMGTKTVDINNPDKTAAVYQECLQYCQAYVENEVKIYFNVGRNDPTGAYLDDALPYQMLKDLYKENGYSDTEIDELVKMEVYEDKDFHEVGSLYYHGATGLMCQNQKVVSWIYQQTKADDNTSLVSKVENEVLNSDIYVYDASSLSTEYTETSISNPVYFIYPDHQINEMGATNLLKELGIKDNLDKYASKAYIINPGDSEYDEEDEKAFINMLDLYAPMASNLKVIGIGNGATFVNQYISQKDWAVAGIMTYGGEAGSTPKYSVPAYVSHSDDTVVDQYVKGNSATQSSTKGSLTTYVNKDNKYEIVVVNSDEESLAEAFANAWSTVLSKNGRIGNIGGTFYSMPTSQERVFQYTSFVIADELGIQINVINNVDLDKDGINNLWYEYLPKSTLNAKEGTVPVVIMLHGNGNDARIQFETSGWAQVAAENGIILVSPEWQGTPKFDAMTTDDSTSEQNDIITMISVLKEKYPQIDASRIYVEGLSRGGLNSLGLGLTQSKTFAAIGVHSAGARNTEEVNTLDSLQKFVNENKDDIDMPIYFVVGDKDHNPFVPFYEENADLSVYNAVELYGELNNIDIPKLNELDKQYSEYFGMNLKNYGDISNNGTCDMIGGVLTNDNGVAISLNIVKNWGHWNYEPTAQLMWNFFKQYSRNTETGETVIVNTDTSKVPDVATSSHKNVKTGDSTNVMLYFVCILLAGSLGYVSLKKIKE